MEQIKMKTKRFPIFMLCSALILGNLFPVSVLATDGSDETVSFENTEETTPCDNIQAIETQLSDSKTMDAMLSDIQPLSTPPADNSPSDTPPSDNLPSDTPPADNPPSDTPSPDHIHSFVMQWSFNKTNHWHNCTLCGKNCLNEPGSETGAHGSWSDGKCGICRYTCKHGGAKFGICQICNMDLGPDLETSDNNNSSEPATQTDPNEVRAEYEKKLTFKTLYDAKIFDSRVPLTAYDLSDVYTPAGFINGIQQAVTGAKESNQDKAVIYSSYPLNFNADVLNAMRAGGMDIEYHFWHEGMLYTMTIPKDVDVHAVLGSSPVEGPLFVKKQLDLISLERSIIRGASQNTGNIAINSNTMTTNQNTISVDINSVLNWLNSGSPIIRNDTNDGFNNNGTNNISSDGFLINPLVDRQQLWIQKNEIKE